MSEIRVNVTPPSLAGLDVLTRKVDELQQKLAAMGAAVQGATAGVPSPVAVSMRPATRSFPVPPSSSIPFSAPPSVAGASSRATRSFPRPPGIPPAPAPSPPVSPSPAPTPNPLAGWQVLPGGGIRLAGYQGTQTAGTYAAQAVNPPVPPPPMPLRPTTPVPPPGFQALPQALPPLDAITRALGIVDTQARRVFLTLRELAQRNRQQGFLGEQDQRTFVAAQRQWETLSRNLEADRHGASARTSITQRQLASQTLSPLATTQAQQQLAQSQQQVTQLTQRQQAMALLERSAPAQFQPPPEGSGIGVAALAALRRFGPTAIAIGVGVSAFQLLNQSLENYEMRSRGALQISGQLGLKYADIDTRVGELRDSYRMLTVESLAAMNAMGRSTGNILGIFGVSAFARAHRMEPADVAGMYGTLSRLSTAQFPNLQAISLAQREAGTAGLRPLPLPQWMEETTKLAGVGGIGAAPLSEDQYGHLMTLMTSFGPRFGQQPAEAFEHFAAGMRSPATPAFQALREQAVAELAARQPTVMLGDRRLNIRESYRDFQTALQQGAFIPEVQASYYQKALQHGGGNPDLQRVFWQGMTKEQENYIADQTFAGFQALAAKPGGIVANMRRPTTPTEREAQRQREVAAFDEQQQTPGGLIERRRAQMQSDIELVKGLEKVRSELINTLVELPTPMTVMKDNFEAVGRVTMELVDKFKMLITSPIFSMQGGFSVDAPIMELEAMPHASRYAPGYQPHLLAPDEYTTLPRKPR